MSEKVTRKMDNVTTAGGARLKTEVLILNRDELLGLFSWKEIIDLVDKGYKARGSGKVIQPQKEPFYIDAPENNNFFIAMPAYMKNLGVGGVKFCSDFSKRAPGQPLGYALILLCDPKKTGEPYCIMDGGLVTVLRTAGHAGVAAKYLAKKKSQKLAIIGCGLEALPHLAIFNELYRLKSIMAYDIKPDAISRFQKESEFLSLEIKSAKTPRAAVENADIVCVITTAQKPVVLDSWIPEGCFVAGLMGFLDLDPILSKKADKWVLGDRSSDGHWMIDRHLDGKVPFKLSKRDVYADMGEIATGAKPGRENDKERIVYTHMGMGTHDLMVADMMYKKAIAQGLGRKVRVI